MSDMEGEGNIAINDQQPTDESAQDQEAVGAEGVVEQAGPDLDNDEDDGDDRAEDGREEEEDEDEDEEDDGALARDDGGQAVTSSSDGQLPDQAQHGEVAPSSTPEPNTLSVHCVVLPSGRVVELNCSSDENWQQLGDKVAHHLNTSAAEILLFYQGQRMSAGTLQEAGVQGNTVELEVRFSADSVASLAVQGSTMSAAGTVTETAHHMPDSWTIPIQVEVNGEKQTKDVHISVKRTAVQKPFLGGFRHKQTGTEYHNASAQTWPKIRPDDGIKRFSRAVQTVKVRQQRQQTTIDAATQMTKTGCYVSSERDKIIVPGRYQTAEEYHANILQKIIIVQKNFRRWQAKRLVNALRRDKLCYHEWIKQEEERRQLAKEARLRREYERRMHPRTKEDFDMLYHAMEKWRLQHTETIDNTKQGAKRKAALYGLLEKETQLISMIGRKQTRANEENRRAMIAMFLEKTAAPKRWTAFDGGTTEMDTPDRQLARYLKEIYEQLLDRSVTRYQRMEALLSLKLQVKEHSCKLTKEIVELVDRETELIERGTPNSALEGLRKRISTLFLHYIETPLFNPEARRHLKVPQDAASLRKNNYFCQSCCRYLPSVEFELSINSRVVTHCRQCKKVDNFARAREDFSFYQALLKLICVKEAEYGDKSTLVYALQEQDLRYLVETIWSGRSAVSLVDDLHELAFVRWDKKQHWSPWNCLLITKEEAAIHMTVDKLEEAYGAPFIATVRQRHVLAYNEFQHLSSVASHQNPSSLSSSVTNSQATLSSSSSQARTTLPPISRTRRLQATQ